MGRVGGRDPVRVQDLLEALEGGEGHLAVLAEGGDLDVLEKEDPRPREVSCEEGGWDVIVSAHDQHLLSRQ